MAAAPQLSDDLRNDMSDAEWQARCDLAALYHIVHSFGWTDTINTHFSARVPGEPDAFLINRYGEMFDEITASSLIKMDMAGRVIGEPGPYNDAGFTIPQRRLQGAPRRQLRYPHAYPGRRRRVAPRRGLAPDQPGRAA